MSQIGGHSEDSNKVWHGVLESKGQEGKLGTVRLGVQWSQQCPTEVLDSSENDTKEALYSSAFFSTPNYSLKVISLNLG